MSQPSSGASPAGAGAPAPAPSPDPPNLGPRHAETSARHPDPSPPHPDPSPRHADPSPRHQETPVTDTAITAQAPSAGPLTFARLKWTSFGHSLIYTALLISAFAAGKPEPLTFVLGLAHGLLWIFMSLACLLATRRRVVPLRVALSVAVLGGIGPFFGSIEFAREQRARSRRELHGGHRHPHNGPR